MLVCAVGDQRLAVASLFIAGIAFGLNSPNIYAIGQTLAGPRAAGKWIGIQNCMGNTAGIVAPIVTGMVVDATGAFTWAFAVTSAVALTGVVGWGLMIRRVEPIDWAAATSSKSGAEVFAA
jgi:nitrate/nitrite transporter NarK